MLDIQKIREDFPILHRKIHGKPFDKTQGKRLVYLDNAATSQKPRQVIEAITNYYQNHNANVHRGIHALGDEATNLYQESRAVVAKFIGAADPNELIFVRNTTEAINLVAYSWGMKYIGRDDVILTTEMEHHSNIVPWQELAGRVGARVEYVRVDEESGELDLEDLERKLELKPKLVAVVQVSNFLGSINEIARISQMVADKTAARVLVDGAQAVPHMPVDVGGLGCDFYAFSGHKMFGPMGIGGLWVRREILEEMPAFMTGGGTISQVSQKRTVFADLPDRFDAGTPNVAGAVGLKAAVEYLTQLGMRNIFEHEQQLVGQAIERLSELSFVKIYGPEDVKDRGGLVAFEVKGVHAHDVAQVLDSEAIAVRSGHHCVMPMHTKLGLAATTRASFAAYNSQDEVDRLIEGLKKVKQVFRI